MIRVINSFADGLVNFNPTGPVEDQTQKLISSTAVTQEPLQNSRLGKISVSFRVKEK